MAAAGRRGARKSLPLPPPALELGDDSPMCAPTRAPCMDWPLSRSEKREQLLRLFVTDLRVTDALLRETDLRVDMLTQELEELDEHASKQSYGRNEAMRAHLALPTPPRAQSSAPAPSPEVPIEARPLRRRRVRSICTADEGCDVRRSRYAPEASAGSGGSGAYGRRRRASWDAGDRGAEGGDERPAHNLDGCGSLWRYDEERPSVRPAVTGRHAMIFDYDVPRSVGQVGLAFLELPPAPLVVRKVVRESWADEQGLQVGDEVVAVCGHPAALLSGRTFSAFMQVRPLWLTVQRITAAGDPTKSSSSKTWRTWYCPCF